MEASDNYHRRRSRAARLDVHAGRARPTGAGDEARLATRIVELEHTVTALLAENRRLRREVLELQH